MAALHPWQQQTLNSGLMLAAASDIALDADSLAAQTRAAIDSVPVAARGHHGSGDGSWTAITLVEMPRDPQAASGTPGTILAHLPLLERVMASLGGTAHGAYILRQPPRGMLRWHFDPQGLHLPLCRLLLTVKADPAAFTWIGHERAAFAPGTLWTGDFAFPHQVENPCDGERLVIALDYLPTDLIRAHFPAALCDRAHERIRLAREACVQLNQWRHALAS